MTESTRPRRGTTDPDEIRRFIASTMDEIEQTEGHRERGRLRVRLIYWRQRLELAEQPPSAKAAEAVEAPPDVDPRECAVRRVKGDARWYIGTKDNPKRLGPWEDWIAAVQAATGITPNGDIPDFVPKLPPFYAAGNANAPAEIDELQGAKLAHWLFAKQRMGAVSGSGPADRSVQPTLSTFMDYRPFGLNYSDIPTELREEYDDMQGGLYRLPPGTEDDEDRYDWPWAQVPTDDDILEWIRAQKGQAVAGLENVDYRSLQFSPTAGPRPAEPATPEDAHYYSSVVPNDAWTSVNMLDVARALKDDMEPATHHHTWSTPEVPATFEKDHYEYEIRPGFPWRGLAVNEDHSAHDGLQRNPSLWFKSLMPSVIQVPGDGNLFGRWAFVIFGIVFQEMDDWKMRNWSISVSYPGGSETIAIPTPWD